MANDTDERIGKNVKTFRGEMTMDILAAKMRLHGHKWTPATVAKVEGGTRQLRLNEAADLLECCGYGIEHMPQLVQTQADATITHKMKKAEDLLANIRRQFHNVIIERTELQRIYDGGWGMSALFDPLKGEKPTPEMQKKFGEWLERFSVERIKHMGIPAVKEFVDNEDRLPLYGFFDSINTGDSTAEDAEE